MNVDKLFEHIRTCLDPMDCFFNYWNSSFFEGHEKEIYYQSERNYRIFQLYLITKFSMILSVDLIQSFAVKCFRSQSIIMKMLVQRKKNWDIAKCELFNTSAFYVEYDEFFWK